MAIAEGNLAAEMASFDAEVAGAASKRLAALIRPEDLVGDLLKIDYAEAEVLVHDHLRQKVGGLPLGCFLLATRLAPGSGAPPADEDTSLILLRVTGQWKLPNAAETDLNRFLAGQRVATEDDVWDAEGKTDQFTLHQLRYAGVKCRVLGTYRMRESRPSDWRLTFGADISNFYSGRGMKVYKPVGTRLSQIVNFAKPGMDDAHPLSGKRVPVGRLRYASSECVIDPEGEGVEVSLDPTDLIARRTALFGMSRTGKSNTTKVIAASVFKIREQDPLRGRIGQLIFDVNGEYANENTQDGGAENPSCLKNVAQHTRGAKPDDVVTYGMWPHPNGPNRRIVKINFFGNAANWTDRDAVIEGLETLYIGKTLIDAKLAEYGDKYIKSFQTTLLEAPKEWDKGTAIRYQRLILAYRAALAAADFEPPTNLSRPMFKGLFSVELRNAMTNSASTDGNDVALYQEAATIFVKDTGSWSEAIQGMKGLRRFMEDSRSGFQAFNTNYMRTHDGRKLG